MKELDRIYEEIERLLEAQNIKNAKLPEDIINGIKSTDENEKNAALLKAKETAKSYDKENKWTPIGLSSKGVPSYKGQDEKGNEIIGRLVNEYSKDGDEVNTYIKGYEPGQTVIPTGVTFPEGESIVKKEEPVIEQPVKKQATTEKKPTPPTDGTANFNYKIASIFDNPQTQELIKNQSSPIEVVIGENGGPKIQPIGTANSQSESTQSTNVEKPVVEQPAEPNSVKGTSQEGSQETAVKQQVSPVEQPVPQPKQSKIGDSLKRTNWEDVLREAQEILREAEGTNSLNAYFTDNIKNALNAKNITITKVMAGKSSGDVLLINDDGKGIDLKDLGITTNGNEKSESTENTEDSKTMSISKPVTLTELVELSPKIEQVIGAVKNNIPKAIQKVKELQKFSFDLTKFELGNYVKDTVLNEAIENNKNKEEKENKEDKEKTKKETTKGNCEVYVNSEFTLNIAEGDVGKDLRNQIMGDDGKEDPNKKQELMKKALELVAETMQKEVVNALNSKSKEFKIKTRTKNDSTFTGYDAQNTFFTFAPGKKTNLEVSDEEKGEYSLAFTFIIKKGNAKDTVGTKIDKITQVVSGVSNFIGDKMNTKVKMSSQTI